MLLRPRIGEENKLLNPERSEINNHTIRLIIGLIALSLAGLTSFFSETEIQSISASYYEGDWARNIFVGFLFALAAFLIAYNGSSIVQMILSKVAALCAVGVAMFPCACGGYPEIIKGVHGASAAVMFLVLAFFCCVFFQRANAKDTYQAKARACIYAVCFVVIVLSIAMIALDHLLHGAIAMKINRLAFYGEAAGLISFGIAWLTASRALPLITSSAERVSLSPFKNQSN